MATGKSGPSGFDGRPSDPYVQQRITDPAAAVPATVTLTGLLGDSDRPGRRRLYFTTALDYYAEFASADVVAAMDVPADQPPFRGLEATRVVLKRDARVEYTHARVAAEDDQFNLAPRRRRSSRVRRPGAFGADTDDGCGGTDDDCPPETWEAECNPSFDGDCNTDFGCGSDNDCPSGWTVCKPHTCNCTEGGATCHATCAGTCANTCRATCVNTCAGTCANTCAATCAGTCAHTCAGTCNATCAGTCGLKCEPTFAQTHCFTCRAGCNPV